MNMQSFQRSDPDDVFVLSYSSDVEILYKTLKYLFNYIHV